MTEAYITKRFVCKVITNEILNIFYIKDLNTNDNYYYVYNECLDEEKFKMLYTKDSLPEIFHQIILRCKQNGGLNHDINEDTYNEYGPYIMRDNIPTFIRKVKNPYSIFNYDDTCNYNIHYEKEENYINWLSNILYISRE